MYEGLTVKVSSRKNVNMYLNKQEEWKNVNIKFGNWRPSG